LFRGYQEKMREMLDIAASQVDNNVRRQVRTHLTSGRNIVGIGRHFEPKVMFTRAKESNFVPEIISYWNVLDKIKYRK
jgi:hypothetical protein